MRKKRLSLKSSRRLGGRKWLKKRRKSSREERSLLRVRGKAVRAKRRRRSRRKRVSWSKLILRREEEMGILRSRHQLKWLLLPRNLRRGQGLRELRKVVPMLSLGNLLKKRK